MLILVGQIAMLGEVEWQIAKHGSEWNVFLPQSTVRMAGSFMCQHVYCTQGFLLPYVILPTVNEIAIYRTHFMYNKKNLANSVNNRLCGSRCTLHVLGSREIKCCWYEFSDWWMDKGKGEYIQGFMYQNFSLTVQQINRRKATVWVSDEPKIVTRKFGLR